LSAICKGKRKYAKNIIQAADRSLISAICDCAYNALKGNITLNDEDRKILYKYRNKLHSLIAKSNLKTKKQLIIRSLNQKGGWLLPVLTALLGSVPTLIEGAKAVFNKFSQ
jgi:hypothetical protein